MKSVSQPAEGSAPLASSTTSGQPEAPAPDQQLRRQSGGARAAGALLTSSSSSGSSSCSSSGSAPTSAASSANYLASLVNKSSSLLGTLKQQYASHKAAADETMQSSGTSSRQQQQQQSRPQVPLRVGERAETQARPQPQPLRATKSQQAIIVLDRGAGNKAETNCARTPLGAPAGPTTHLGAVASKQGERDASSGQHEPLVASTQVGGPVCGSRERQSCSALARADTEAPAGHEMEELGGRRHERDTSGPALRTRSSTMDTSSAREHSQLQQQQQQQQLAVKRPPLPPPPPRELVEACVARATPTHSAKSSPPNSSNGNSNQQQQQQVAFAGNTSSARQPAKLSCVSPHQSRRHALQELSLERDAALSLKGAHSKELKHKRASSIKSALRHAHLGPLRSSSSGRRAAEKAAAATAAALVAAANSATGRATVGGESGGKLGEPKSKPYELFEPPVTQRTFERSKRRRGAMQTDARRQMSADTIGLRQLTDEYLQNAGVQQFVLAANANANASASAKQPAGQHYSSSLVALSGPLQQQAPAKPGTIAVPGGSSTVAAIAAASSASGAPSASSQAQCALEAQLYQATRQAAARLEQQRANQSGAGLGEPRATAAAPGQEAPSTSASGSNNSINAPRQPGQLAEEARLRASAAAAAAADEDPLSQVTMLPGSLPWQCDVSIQCQLLQAPPMVEPYETTGDILDTIARPFRAPTLSSHAAASFDTSPAPGFSQHAHGHGHSHSHAHHHHLSATLKRGLSAISQHHLSPGNAGTSAGSMALNVVGSLKKSISNTFDVGVKTAGGQAASSLQPDSCGVPSRVGGFLRSQDSLPAYSNLLNEPDEEAPTSAASLDVGANQQQQQQQSATQALQQTGLIGQLASKLTRQSSKQFTVSKKGLQRALSFDYRGYKRLGGQQQQQQKPPNQVTLAHSAALQTSADSTGSSCASANSANAATAASLLAARQKAHNKSTLALQSPRPYLPQSASQVDFQVPLLPYDRMQEAIVSQRLLEPPATSAQSDLTDVAAAAAAASSEPVTAGAANENDTQQSRRRSASKQAGERAHQPDADELICGRRRQSGAGLGQTRSEPGVESAARNDLVGATPTALGRRRRPTPPPCLVLNTPPGAGAGAEWSRQERPLAEGGAQNNGTLDMRRHYRDRGAQQESALESGRNRDADDDEDDEDDDEEEASRRADTCLPSPNVLIESVGFALEGRGASNNVAPAAGLLLAASSSGQMSQSPSFCIEPDGKSASFKHHSQQSSADGAAGGLLTANDVFSKSKNFIKRPSTMMAADDGVDAMNQVVLALESKAAKHQQQQQQQLAARPSVRSRNRRQAIVPPKLATDACTSSDSESREQVECATLVDLAADDQDERDERDDQEPPLDGTAGGRGQMALAAARAQQRTAAPARRRSGRRRQPSGAARQPTDEFASDEEAALSGIRRKRSGGGIEKSAPAAAHASDNNNLPTFQIERDDGQRAGLPPAAAASSEECRPRPDSQATNASESIVSSGSSVTLSAQASGRFSSNSGALSPIGGCGGSALSVPFGSNSRRRSSIAVIPQMQICPGDLLVYSKQLIERMNQSDENEPPQFLTIDDKKGKTNIWSSFKLCAQFDNRTMRARNELLCSLEDVLASLQPSTFVDEQLSHYKGMLWNEFLYETESRRSASSENGPDLDQQQETAGGGGGGGGAADDREQGPNGVDAILAEADSEREWAERLVSKNKKSYRDDLIDVRITTPSPLASATPTPAAKKPAAEATHKRWGSMRGDEIGAVGGPALGHESLKVTMSTGASGGHTSPARTAGPGAPARGQEQQARALSSRFREKPKLKRGQTVDSVFRIPLIPSSPLKHAQLHQQTPTAHLEEHALNTIEDDERSSMGSATSGAPAEPSTGECRPDARRKRSSSTRSRSGSRANANQAGGAGAGCELDSIAAPGGTRRQAVSQESSFDADDTNDLLQGGAAASQGHAAASQRARPAATPNQMVRQSSLSTLSSTVTRTEQKRQRALWDLFQSECTFFFDHLMTLKNVYMEPLKKIQVEGFAMFADPDVLFGNLDELCCGVYDFCKEFLYIIMRTLKTRPEELNATDVLIKLYKKNPKIDHLRAVYHRYTLNYINALTYLESLRRQVEFVEFEKWSSRDVRCKKLQLTDLLVAPVQHIMRVPIILKDIEAHTEQLKDRDEIRAILAVEEASLRELDDKMRWLKNFERLLEIQKNISWPSVLDMDSKLFVPDFLKEVLSKQPCEKLIVSPRRQIVHEGTLSNLDASGKPSDMHVILFDDMLLMTRRKKALTKKSSTVCKTNSAGHHASPGGAPSSAPSAAASNVVGSMLRDDGTFKYVVYKQPLSLDRFYVHDVQQVDSQPASLRHLFLLIVMNRFQQIIAVHSFAAPNDDIKQTWLFKIKKTAERWKRNYSSAPASSEQPKQPLAHQQQPNPNQSVQQQQQQQISTSKSMPMEALSQCKRPLAARPAVRESSAGIRPLPVDQDEPSATVRYQSRQQARLPAANGAQPPAPIEFVITSACDSAAGQPASESSHSSKC